MDRRRRRHHLQLLTLADEGAHALRGVAAALTPARLCKMAWLMPRAMRAVPYLGYVVIAGTNPAT